MARDWQRVAWCHLQVLANETAAAEAAAADASEAEAAPEAEPAAEELNETNSSNGTNGTNATKVRTKTKRVVLELAKMAKGKNWKTLAV